MLNDLATSPPRITALIPCYNGAKYLSETLDSVLAQTYLPIEVLVVDDGSTDDSVQIAEEYGGIVSVICQENQGVSAARNHGIEQAQGDWIAFLDADDIWKPEKLEKQVQAIDSKTVGLHTSYYNFGASTGVCDLSEIPAETRYSLEYVALHSPLNTSSLMVKKSISPRFPEWTGYAEDAIFQLDLVQLGEVKLVAEPLTGYRRHDESVSRARTLFQLDIHKTICNWLEINRDSLSPEASNRILNKAIIKLVEATKLSKWRRDWDAFEQLRAYLKQYDQHEAVQAFLRQKVLPKFAYQLKDWLAPPK